MDEGKLGTIAGGTGGAISEVAQREWNVLAAPGEGTRGENVQESLSRVSRGEPVSKELIDDLVSTIHNLVAAPDTLPSLTFKKLPNVEEVHLDNRYACRPFLKDALEPGQDDPQHARSEYERRRLSQLDFIPEYARSMCLKECRDSFRKVTVTIDSELEERSTLLQFARKFNTEHIKEENLLDYSHFSACMTFEAGARLLEALRPAEFKRHYSVSHLGSEVLVHDRFSPGSDGPLGKAATEAWQKMSHIALAAVILEDLLPQLPFPVSEDVKRSAIEKALAPRGSAAWNIANSPLVTNTQKLHELYEAGAVSTDVVEVVSRDPKALFRADLKDKIEDISHALATREARRKAVAVSQGVNPES